MLYISVPCNKTERKEVVHLGRGGGLLIVVSVVVILPFVDDYNYKGYTWDTFSWDADVPFILFSLPHVFFSSFIFRQRARSLKQTSKPSMSTSLI